MTFLNPLFLIALSAISIPIIIHLFSFRVYKTVYFSNVEYLKNIKHQTKSKSRLKQILILISRILAIAALVLAFARPYIHGDNKKAEEIRSNLVSIYIDNSFSMDSKSKYGNLLEVAKNKARSIIKAYPVNTKFLLVTNKFDSKHQHWVGKDQLEVFINNIKVTPFVRQISQIVSRQKDYLNTNDKISKINKTIYLISDFQKSSTDFESIANDTIIKTHLIPLATNNTNNIYIDSCWFDSPVRKLNKAENMNIKIINKSDESYQNIPIKLEINGKQRALASFNIEKNSSEIVKLTYTNTNTGILNGKIEISDYPITYDNAFYFSYYIAEKIKMIIINNTKDKYIKALFQNDSYFEIHEYNVSNVPVSEFKESKLLIINNLTNLSTGLIDELVKYVKLGGTVFFIPNFEGNINEYNIFLNRINSNFITGLGTNKTKIENINYNHFIYNTDVFKQIDKNLELPYINKYFKFSNLTKTNDEMILSTFKIEKILSMTNLNKGKVYILSIPLNKKYNNFVTHPLFVPTLYNIALYSQSISKLYYIIGKKEFIEIENKNTTNKNIYKISNTKGDYEFIPKINNDISANSIRLNMMQSIYKSGIYLVKYDNIIIKGIAYNFNRKESDLEYYTNTEIENKIEKNNLFNINILNSENKLLSYKIEQISKGTQLWKLFIILALVFLAIEIILIRTMNTYKKKHS